MAEAAAASDDKVRRDSHDSAEDLDNSSRHGVSSAQVGARTSAGAYKNILSNGQLQPTDSGRSPESAIAQRLWLSNKVRFALHVVVLLAFVVCGLIYPPYFAISGDVPIDSGFGIALLLIDVLLWLDVLCAFITPAFDEGSIVFSHRLVACTYLRRPTGLLLDILARFPWDLARGTRGFSWGHLARTALLQRSLTIVYEESDGAPRAISSITRLTLLVTKSTAVVHWYACGVYLIGRSLLENSADGESIGWLAEQGYDAWPAWERYVRALNRALLIMIGEGGEAHGSTGAEIAFATVGASLGVVLIAYFTGSLVQLIFIINQEEVDIARRLEMSLRFLRRLDLPQELHGRAVAHLRKVLLYKMSSHAHSAFEQLSDLSPALVNEIALFQMFPLIMSPAMSAILRPDGGAVDPSFLKLLVRHLVAVCFSPSDFIIEEGDQGNEVYFLASGILDVLKGETTVATLKSGACFGEIALLVPNATRTASIIARSFSNAYMLTREHFETCIERFPQLEKRIKKMAQQRLKELKAVADVKPTLTAEGSFDRGSDDDSFGRRRSWNRDPAVLATAAATRMMVDMRQRAEGDDSFSKDRRRFSFGSNRESRRGSWPAGSMNGVASGSVFAMAAAAAASTNAQLDLSQHSLDESSKDTSPQATRPPMAKQHVGKAPAEGGQPTSEPATSGLALAPTAESEATEQYPSRARIDPLVTPPLSRNSQQVLPPLPKPRAQVVWPGNGNAQSPEGSSPGTLISGEEYRAPPSLPPPKSNQVAPEGAQEEAPRGRRAKRWGGE